MTKNSHSIQKVFLEIDTHSILMANSIKNSLAMFVQNEVVPILERQFDSIKNIDNQIIQIEKIEFSINSNTGKTDIFLSSSEAKNDIKNQIEKEIQKRLNEGQKTSKNETEIHTISPENKDLKTLLYFIENGSMPWWISKVDGIVFFKEINPDQFNNDIFRIPFSRLIQQKKIQNRIINQFSNQEIAVFTSALLGRETQQKTLSKNNLLQFLSNKPYDFKTSFWRLLFEVSNGKKPMEIILFYHQKQAEFSSEKMPFELFIQNLKTFFPLNTSDTKLKKMNDNYLDSEKAKSILKLESIIENLKDKKENTPCFESEIQSKNEDTFQEEETNSESCYLQNAGLIILHPFLKEMLKNCDLIDDNNTIIDKELAAHILHYAATKKENDYEHLMLFEKFLCGIEIQQSIPREIKIEEKHKLQVEEMLQSVVEHWSALKSTSTDILRTEFLQREGKLEWSESNPKLTIERKAQDLLLEKIPWNITIVKIPWIEKLIYTQW